MGVTEANDKVLMHRQEIRDVEMDHFAPFSETTGITDFRAYDDAISKAREDFVKKRTDIREQLAKVSETSCCPWETSTDVILRQKTY